MPRADSLAQRHAAPYGRDKIRTYPMSYRIDSIGPNAREIVAIDPSGFESTIAIVESDDCDAESLAIVASFVSCPF